jgi:lipopolysaccharide export system permease protein
MTFGNMGERSELVALKTAGISMGRTARGLFLAVMLMSMGSLAFSNYIVPSANLKFWTTLLDISRSKPALNIKENVFYKDIDPYIIKVDRKDPDGKGIHGIMIRDYSDYQHPHNFITAERGEMYTTEDQKYLVLKLYNGAKYEGLPPDPEKRGVSLKLRTQFESMEKVMDLSTLKLTRSREDVYKNQQQMLNIAQLKDFIDSLQVQRMQLVERTGKEVVSRMELYADSAIVIPAVAPPGDFETQLRRAARHMSQLAATAVTRAKSIKQQLENPVVPQWHSMLELIRRAQIELHRKYTSAFACAVLFLIGAPFGVIVRKGGLALPVIAATLLYILFLILYKLGESLGKNGTIDPVAGMWAPPLIMVPLAVWLVYMANTDAAMLQLETYRLPRFIKSLVRRKQ